MKMNQKWGYGQLFGYSGLEGKNRYYFDNILMTMSKVLTFRFEFRKYILMTFDVKEKVKINALMSDFVDATVGDKPFFLTFLDNDTLVGISPVMPEFKGEKKLEYHQFGKVDTYLLDNEHALGLRGEKRGDVYRFIIHHSFNIAEARSGANRYFDSFDLEELKKQRYAYYEKMPKCRDKKYEKLYYKSLSINKVNVHTPEGQIDDYWTTPDRVPHKNMWLWDSAFHGLAMVQYNPDIAERQFLSILKAQRENGFIPHMANPTDQSDVTQPCVMSWAAFEMYKVTKNKEFLVKCLPYLEKYLVYDMNNRDNNKNGLLEWLTEPEYMNCKCGESGLDNSPRFDFDEDMDAIDFSTYFALDTKYLSLIYKELGNEEKSNEWKAISDKTAKTINDLMFSKEKGVYFDRLFNGKLTNVLTPSSFLPMMAGIVDEKYIDKMVEVLTDKTELWCDAPVASISQKDSRFSNDMWRGGVWLNLNYFIILGLRKYGRIELANQLRDQTLEMVDKWYKKTGTIFEFFDPYNKVAPWFCERKGAPLRKPDYRKHVHSISDYNWSACFTILLIQNIYYI